MSDLLSKLQGAYSDDDEEQNQQETISKVEQIPSQVTGLKRVVPPRKVTQLLRTLNKGGDSSSSDEEEDIMKAARMQISVRNAQDKVMKKPEEKREENGGAINIKLKEMLDPKTQKLFEMLPAPKSSSGQTFSTALKS